MLELFYQMRRAHRFIGTALAGTSPAMGAVREKLWNNLFTHDVAKYDRYLWNRMEDFSTLLVGETGTGKSAAAQAIGFSGFVPFDEERQRFQTKFSDAFVAVNLSEFPSQLVESELFGHRKGAFTGAVDAHEGWFSRCHEHGSVFLDEIGDLAPEVQVKLLRVLQDRSYSPVGSHERRRFSGRVVAATHRPIERLVAEGTFRSDFYYRLCSDVIELPPLRQQLEGEPALLGELVETLLTRILGERFEDLTAHVTSVIERDVGRRHPFDGNVRELEQLVRRVLLAGHAHLGTRSAPSTPHEARAPFLEQAAKGELDADELLGHYCALLYDELGSYADVAARTRLDPRTVKRHIATVRPV
jgi:transcriptional regulator with GAF, ATPase, and Fis domain